ncbi:carboxylate-amine ligase [Cellulomonas marina]|uniref:Putative glutamate--cysteine ligase 2 n=1 Tax=Cellulomonas marina TaxID=988821 RepID=A0A1I0W491_9CELL|nr:glutamate--cysteine ligase [Cellulomonas marina]GIG29981.1 putative glutamate--cysteine ligase 2 [Cellulomonas marina]SFA83421.1 carboxylate-amine ligase [Cellulomonas marina]
MGVEEEYLLVTPGGRPTAVAGAVLALEHAREAEQGRAEHSPGPGGDLEKEFTQEQIETSTPPCAEVGELLEQLRAGRLRAETAAQRAGAHVVALGTAPQEVHATVVPEPRSLEIEARFGQTAADQLTCGCHVHVRVADDEEGVRVLDHLRPWNAVLLALSANSPWFGGRDTGYASFRSQVWGRWPTAGPTGAFGDAAGYREVTEALLATRTILDPGMLYFDARLSARYPTVEVRVADVCLDARDAALLGALVRGLADTAVADDGRAAAPPVRTEVLRAAAWQSAHAGLTGDLVCPVRGVPRPAAEVLERLLDHVRPALRATGDLAVVEDGLADLLARGTGSAEQHRWRAEGAGDDEVVRRACARTLD